MGKTTKPQKVKLRGTMYQKTRKKRGSVVWLEANGIYHIAVVVSKQNGMVGVSWAVAAASPCV